MIMSVDYFQSKPNPNWTKAWIFAEHKDEAWHRFSLAYGTQPELNNKEVNIIEEEKANN